jgi:hypothetical protein
VIELFATHSTSAAVLVLVGLRLPTTMAAVLSGASIRGLAGQADRMTLFRRLGVCRGHRQRARAESKTTTATPGPIAWSTELSRSAKAGC